MNQIVPAVATIFNRSPPEPAVAGRRGRDRAGAGSRRRRSAAMLLSSGAGTVERSLGRSARAAGQVFRAATSKKGKRQQLGVLLPLSIFEINGRCYAAGRALSSALALICFAALRASEPAAGTRSVASGRRGSGNHVTSADEPPRPPGRRPNIRAGFARFHRRRDGSSG